VSPRDLILPPSVDVDGNFALLAAPKSAVTTWPPKFSDVTAPTTVDITYSLTTDGWSHGKAQDATTDPRFALRQVLGGFGAVTHTASLTYVYGSDEDVADPLLQEGEEYVLFARYATPWDDELAQTDKFDVFSVITGTKVRNTAVGGKFTKTQALAPRRNVLEDQVLAAA
jgi:hypothetical protein